MLHSFTNPFAIPLENPVAVKNITSEVEINARISVTVYTIRVFINAHQFTTQRGTAKWNL